MSSEKVALTGHLFATKSHASGIGFTWLVAKHENRRTNKKHELQHQKTRLCFNPLSQEQNLSYSGHRLNITSLTYSFFYINDLWFSCFNFNRLIIDSNKRGLLYLLWKSSSNKNTTTMWKQICVTPKHLYANVCAPLTLPNYIFVFSFWCKNKHNHPNSKQFVLQILMHDYFIFNFL